MERGQRLTWLSPPRSAPSPHPQSHSCHHLVLTSGGGESGEVDDITGGVRGEGGEFIGGGGVRGGGKLIGFGGGGRENEDEVANRTGRVPGGVCSWSKPDDDGRGFREGFIIAVDWLESSKGDDGFAKGSWTWSSPEGERAGDGVGLAAMSSRGTTSTDSLDLRAVWFPKPVRSFEGCE